MSVMDLKGVVTAVVTPFKEDESLDLPALREYVEYVVSVPGVNGILTCGYSGEGGGLNRDEQLSVVRAVTETVNGRIPVISGISPTSTKDTIEFGNKLKEAGVSALQINSPFYNILRRGYLREEEIAVKFFNDLAAGVGLPMTVFQYSRSSGLTYPASTIARLSENEKIIGFKEAVEMEVYEADFKAVAGRKLLYADNNTYTLVSMLLYGSDGSMVGIGNVGVPLWTELNRLIDAGDQTAAIEHANTKIVPLINTFSKDLGNTTFSFIARIKEALVQMGRIPNGTARAPEPAVTELEKEEIRATLVQVGLLS